MPETLILLTAVTLCLATVLCHAGVDLTPDTNGDRIAVVKSGAVSYLPARRVELVERVGGAGACRYIRRSSNGDLYVMGPGIGHSVLHSTDGGLTWSTTTFELDLGELDMPRSARDSPLGFLAAFAILRDDTFVLLLMPSNYQPNTQAVIARSSDFGKTWQAQIMDTDVGPYKFVQGGNSDILELADGTILATVDLRNGRHDDELAVEQRGLFNYALRSLDGGRTWPEKSCITLYAAETHLLQLPSGKLLAAIRKQRGHRLPGDPASPYDLKLAHGYRPQFDSEERNSEKDEDTNRIKNTFLSESTDGGRTWVNERQVTSFLQCSADLTRLEDGTLMLLFLHRYPDDLAHTGIRAKVSDDEGKTWRDELYVISQGHGDDIDTGSSYPGSIATADGGLITVCANWSHGRTRLEAVHWRPGKNF